MYTYILAYVCKDDSVLFAWSVDIFFHWNLNDWIRRIRSTSTSLLLLFYVLDLCWIFLIIILKKSVIDLDEHRLTKKRTSEWYQHSTPLSTGNLALFGQNSHSSPLHIHRRRQTSLGNMTSYSALKRKAQRSDISSNIARVRRSPSNYWNDSFV